MSKRIYIFYNVNKVMIFTYINILLIRQLLSTDIIAKSRVVVSFFVYEKYKLQRLSKNNRIKCDGPSIHQFEFLNIKVWKIVKNASYSSHEYYTYKYVYRNVEK